MRTMMNKRDEILAALQAGPVRFRALTNGRSGAFLVAYRSLLRDGLIEEHGGRRKCDPRYVGLKGTTFPGKGYFVRPADVDLLVRSGMSEPKARAALEKAAEEGGEAAVIVILEQAYSRLLSWGKKPNKHQPPPKNKVRKLLFESAEPGHERFSGDFEPLG
jgi:hypothetical protein